MRLYTFAPFDRGAKVRWLLLELGVPFDDRHLDRKSKEHESPEFLKLNPLGRVPVLELDDGNVFFESGAICLFLADRFVEKGLAPAQSSPLRPEYLQWMLFASATIDTIQTRIMVIEDIVEPELRAAKESALMSDWRDAIEAIDRALSKGGPHLLGKTFTAADICVSYHLYRCTLWPELDVHVGDFPRVRAYLERMQASPIAAKTGVFSQT